jgi:WS/DGAT/MGAT family acyltransferase
MVIVEGLNAPEVAPPGSFAMIYKVHHCAIDGASGTEIMSAILDFTPKPRKVKPPEKPWEPERIPTSMELIARSYGARLGSPLKIFNYLRNNIGGVIDTAAEVLKNKLQPPPFPFTAPHTPFNTDVSHHRIFRTTEMDLKRIKGIKNATGTTVNDTMLAICAGGLRSYLLEKEALPEKPLIAMAPISVRSKTEKGTMGNKVSAMLVDLATNEPDPQIRLQAIHSHASAAKQVTKGLSPEGLLDFVPAELAALSARLYTRMHIPDRTNPVFNLVITNVPGPPMPLYMAGARLLHHFAMAPLLDGLGLLLVIFSYAGKVSLGAISCREIMPDLDKLMAYMQDALDELETSVISKQEEL